MGLGQVVSTRPVFLTKVGQTFLSAARKGGTPGRQECLPHRRQSRPRTSRSASDSFAGGQPAEAPQRIAAMGALIAVGQQPSPALRAAVDGGQVGRLLASRGGGPLRVAKRQRRGHVYGQRRQQEENQRRRRDSGTTAPTRW